MRLLCAGVGQLNRRVAAGWLNLGGTVVGLRRGAADRQLAFPQLSLDLSRQRWPDVAASAVVVAVAAPSRTLADYRQTYVATLQSLARSLAEWQSLPQRVLVVSSSRVFGENGGAQLSDDSPAQPADDYGALLLEMEQLALQLPVPVAVLRLSGIYGPGRDWMYRQALQARAVTTTKWTNRIHIDDAAAAIVHLLRQASLQTHYIVSDQQPMTQLRVFNYLRQRAQRPLIEPAQQPLPEEGKRLHPERLQRTGFHWRYPTALSGGYDWLFADAKN